MKIIFLTAIFFTFTWSESYYYEYDKKVTLTKLKEQKVLGNNLVEYYQNAQGKKVGVTRDIIAKCTKIESCKEIFEKYSLKNFENLTSTLFLIKLNDGDDVFELSQKLYKEEDIVFAHPNFLKKRESR